MTYHGTVENGIIQIQGGLQLPEGAKVRVELEHDSGEKPASTADSIHTFGNGLAALGR